MPSGAQDSRPVYHRTKADPGNPTRSYRTREPVRVVGEVLVWEPHSPEVLRDMRYHLENLRRLGIEAIDD